MKRIDHILINVENLEQAVLDFEQMGFNVFYGNTKKNCHHAMIYFSDKSFIELLDQSKFPSAFKFLAKKRILDCLGIFFKRFASYLISSEQFLDYAIFTDEIDRFYKSKQEINKSKLFKMKRKTHLDTLIKWKLFAFDKIDLPFVMSAYTPDELPEINADKHPNNIIGIKNIAITINGSLEDYCEKFKVHFDEVEIKNNILKIGSSHLIVEEGNRYEIKSLTLATNSNAPIEFLKKYGIVVEDY